jgi:uncharacterized membrane protein
MKGGINVTMNKKKVIMILIILATIILSGILFLKYSPTIEKEDIKSATLSQISNVNEDKKLTDTQTKKIIDFINSAEKTRKLGIAKGWQYKINIQKTNFNTEITLIGDQLAIGGSTYTSKDITKKFKNLLTNIGG